jgi:alpha-L-rhamnosidase
LIRPNLLGDLAWAKARYISAYGEIKNEWSRSGGAFEMNVTIPANCTATLSIPASNVSRVTESGQPLQKAFMVRSVMEAGGRVTCEVGAGSYAIRVI